MPKGSEIQNFEGVVIASFSSISRGLPAKISNQTRKIYATDKTPAIIVKVDIIP